ncbi:MAG TPA: maleylpyruvate isomerase family mycothiol-dependent enzyme [Acidimicrobiia bacterium]|nr:maleylpyruvate isomerase family mycothiol-dependent enzyme [Acidimicrobiia bacterium]
MDLLAHLRSNSSRFAEVLADVAADAPVPCCPDWDASDLLWHLTEVQTFWGRMVAERLTDPEEAENDKPQRPSTREPMLAMFEAATHRLQQALASTPSETRVWTWHDPDQSAGFIGRRQAHEALVHRTDAELTAGLDPVVDADLAVDGVDEILGVMIAGVPEWATFEPDGAAVRIEARDADRHWGLAFGKMRGTSPYSGNSYDLDAATLGLDAPAAQTTIAGPAARLDLWLWGRADLDGVEITGDPDLASRLRQLAIEGTQ